MDIRNGVEGLKTLLGVTSTAPAQEQKAKSGPAAGSKPLGGDHATLSSAGAEVSQTVAESGVRADKVAAVQAALAAGTYSVPASDVAGKVVDSMLGGG
ncbi:MAG: flagellar biosynthesis anti-sigma factor FlgM [Acidobacteriota bacterium]|nr:flagellar biosynthesis anti-sigma factor FlgM [Acidobacteriota bacterium]